nr:hypothetical protein BaRGS_007739 [Batillaria attramentaria]
MSAGEDIFRTFDDASFNFYTTCTVGMLRSKDLQIYTQTECEPDNKCSCKKVVTMEYTFNGQTTVYTLEDYEVRSDGPGGTERMDVTSEKQSPGGETNIVVKKEDSSVYVWFMTEEVSFRLDDNGLFMLTIKRTSPIAGSLGGICGNFDGNADNDQAYLTKLFEDNTDANRPCGSGFEECPADDPSLADEAGVDPEPYYQLCLRGYCTAAANGRDKAELARCNVLDVYAYMCYKEASLSVSWRSENFCSKTCENGMVYTPMVPTACPLTCGMPKKQYESEACRSDGHAGCVCPRGMFLLRGACVLPNDCECMGDDQKYYKNGEVIRSSDKCLECRTSEECVGTCSITGNTVTTYDGLMYSFSAPSCYLTLLQDKGIINNGASLPAVLRKVSTNYFVVDINPGIRIIVSLDGLIQIAAETALHRRSAELTLRTT